jgi:hypothetical protein
MLYINPLKSEVKIPSFAITIMGTGVPRTLVVEVLKLEVDIELSIGAAVAPPHHSPFLELEPPMWRPSQIRVTEHM